MRKRREDEGWRTSVRGESCECLKWNVIRASERRAASEQKALLTSSSVGPRSLRGHRDRTCGANETIYCVKLAVAGRTEKMRERGSEGEREAHFSPLGKRGPESASQADSARTARSSPTSGGCDIDMCVCRGGQLLLRPSSASMGRRGSAAARLIGARRPRRYQRENLRSVGQSAGPLSPRRSSRDIQAFPK